MPKFDVSMPNPNDVNETPRKETVEADDEHAARIVAAERYGWQPTEISEHKSAKKGKSSAASSKKRSSSTTRKRSSSTTKSAKSKHTPVSRKATPTQKADQRNADKKLTADPEDDKGELNSHTKRDGKPANPQSADNSGVQPPPEFKPAGSE